MSSFETATSNNENEIGGIEYITELESRTLDISDIGEECFSEPTLKSISRLGEVLNRIDKRMKREGYSISCGKIVKNEKS
jgi:hypothetical protein